LSLETISDNNQEDNISIDHQLTHNNLALNDYRTFVKSRVADIARMLANLESRHPDLKEELGEPLARCNELLENQQSEGSHNSFLNLEDSKNNTDNMLVSLKYLPPIELFPSQYNF
jgi:uncharacterized membrane-anchored protein YhcB (DUF1043 family)